MGLRRRKMDSRLPKKKREEKGMVEELKEGQAETVDLLLHYYYCVTIYCFFFLSSLQHLQPGIETETIFLEVLLNLHLNLFCCCCWGFWFFVCLF